MQKNVGFRIYWEFGCGQLAAFETFEECLQRTYKEDFNADLKFNNPIVTITTYTLGGDGEKRAVSGIIFLANINSPDQVVALRHAKIEWIDPLNPGDLASGNCAPDFTATMQKARKIWESLQERDYN